MILLFRLATAHFFLLSNLTLAGNEVLAVPLVSRRQPPMHDDTENAELAVRRVSLRMP
jgi:hypothetical protein